MWAVASYIWSQGVGYGKASRRGEGSLTKMSPLQVMDQMACLEGGPWSPLESQHDTLNRASLGPSGQIGSCREGGKENDTIRRVREKAI